MFVFRSNGDGVVMKADGKVVVSDAKGSRREGERGVKGRRGTW